MKLRVFLPPLERPDAATRFAWMLLDARGEVLRTDTTPASDMPRAEEAELVLPASRVLFARLKLPRVSAGTIRELLPFAVEDRLLADPAQIHAVAGATDARGETLVAVVDREWLGAVAARLRAAGQRPVHAWCESALATADGPGWHLVLGRAQGLLVDAEGTAGTFDRPSPEAFPLALRIALDEAAARGTRPASIRVHALGGAPLPDLGRWSAEAGVALEQGADWEALSRGTPGAGAIDLLTDELAPRRAGLSRLRIPRAAVILAAAIALLQLAFTAAQAWSLQRERAALEARQEAIFRGAFPEARVVVDPPLQMERNLAQLRRTHGLASDDDFLAKLTQAARASEAPVQAIDYRDGRLDVHRRGAVKEARQ